VVDVTGHAGDDVFGAGEISLKFGSAWFYLQNGGFQNHGVLSGVGVTVVIAWCCSRRGIGRRFSRCGSGGTMERSTTISTKLVWYGWIKISSLKRVWPIVTVAL
jgi:hypothetical protein